MGTRIAKYLHRGDSTVLAGVSLPKSCFSRVSGVAYEKDALESCIWLFNLSTLSYRAGSFVLKKKIAQKIKEKVRL